MLSRAILTKKVDDTLLLQEYEIELFADEKRKGVERFQFPFLTSVPHEGGKGPGNDEGKKFAEMIVACIGGNRSHMVILAVDDRRYRICGLEQGELMIHDEQGQQVHITRKGINGSVPHDRFIDFRIMKKDSGDPDKPMKEIQASKTKNEDWLATIHFDRTTMTVTHRDKDKDKDGNEVHPTVKEQIVDKDGNAVTSMTMDKDGITWTTNGTLTWNAPTMKWHGTGDDSKMNWDAKRMTHDSEASHDIKAVRTTITSKAATQDESKSLIELVTPSDSGGQVILGTEQTGDDSKARQVVTVQGDAKHTKALPA
jgi:phage gp45-like